MKHKTDLMLFDLQAQIRHMSRSSVSLPPGDLPDGAVVEPPYTYWELQSVNVDDQTVTDPKTNATLRSVSLVSATYVNTLTGEVVTEPVTPVMPHT